MIAKVDPIQDGGRLLRSVRREAIHATGQLADGLKSLQDQAWEELDKAGRALKKRVKRIVKEQKGVAAKKIEEAGSVVHRTARLLEGGKGGPVAGYVEMAADDADQAARYLRTKAPEEIAGDLADLAKRYPVALFTGTLIGGLIAGRLARAAGERAAKQ